MRLYILMNQNTEQNYFLTQEDINILIKDESQYHRNIVKDTYESFKKYNINSYEDIKEFIEQETNFSKFIKTLIKKLKVDGEIICSRRSDYYSLPNSKIKGFDGYEKANKYIFSKYIINSNEYKSYNNKYKRIDIYEDGNANGLIMRFTSLCFDSDIERIYTDIIVPKQMFKLQHKIDYDEL